MAPLEMTSPVSVLQTTGSRASQGGGGTPEKKKKKSITLPPPESPRVFTESKKTRRPSLVAPHDPYGKYNENVRRIIRDADMDVTMNKLTQVAAKILAPTYGINEHELADQMTKYRNGIMSDPKRKDIWNDVMTCMHRMMDDESDHPLLTRQVMKTVNQRLSRVVDALQKKTINMLGMQLDRHRVRHWLLDYMDPDTHTTTDELLLLESESLEKRIETIAHDYRRQVNECVQTLTKVAKQVKQVVQKTERTCQVDDVTLRHWVMEYMTPGSDASLQDIVQGNDNGLENNVANVMIDHNRQIMARLDKLNEAVQKIHEISNLDSRFVRHWLLQYPNVSVKFLFHQPEQDPDPYA